MWLAFILLIVAVAYCPLFSIYHLITMTLQLSRISLIAFMVILVPFMVVLVVPVCLVFSTQFNVTILFSVHLGRTSIDVYSL